MLDARKRFAKHGAALSSVADIAWYGVGNQQRTRVVNTLQHPTKAKMITFVEF
jgi:hypothetical protein